MIITHQFAAIRIPVFASILSALLTGCLTAEQVEDPTPTIESSIQLSGSVGDGPIVGASMRVLANDGAVLAEFSSNASAGYDVTVTARGDSYPLSIDARGGTDLVTGLPPGFELRGAVLAGASQAVANVNPFSTLALEIARDLNGGINQGNIVLGQQIAVTGLNSGLTSLVSGGPMSTRIDASNITEIVKSSEALGEVIRRTRNRLNAFGIPVNGDQVIGALGSDLVDRVIDGQGGPRANARIAAVASIVAAQVSLEAMANELHVNGVNATNVMINAIQQVSNGPAQQSLDELTATGPMLAQTRVALAAAAAVTGDAQIEQLTTTLNGIQPGLDSMLIRNLLPSDYRQILDNVITMIAGGDLSMATGVNDAVRAGGGNPQINRPPVITGTPPPMVQANTAYAFTPTATDADLDELLFSVTGLPAWAQFDNATGAITGTPGDADINTFTGITITVADLTDSATLGPFSIQVTALPVNTAPTITGTPPASVQANTAYAFTPTATDADGDQLSFSVVGLPPWAMFDTETGAITGTPGDADVNTYPGITITVTDLVNNATLGPFTITVGAVSLGSATLTWTPPTVNTDGTPLTDLAGFKVYWGTGGRYTNSVTIDNPGVTSYVIDNLPPGTYEFVATAFNTGRIESPFSNPATKTIP